MKNNRILILVNKYTTITKFRLEVVQALVEQGYDVYVSVPEHDCVNEIKAVDATIIPVNMDKNGMNPVDDFKLMLYYRKLMKKLKPAVVLTYTIKPNVYGGMAATLCKIPYVANITGLGTALEKGGMLQKLALQLYKMGLKHVSKVFFQNEDNRKFFEKHNIALGKHDSIPGSGVNLQKFVPLPYEEKDTVAFAFISRIMKEKGIEQYLDAARVIQTKYPHTEFHVCGFGDSDYEEKMEKLHEDGLIIYHGLLHDVRGMLQDSHCIIHPTFYPEGMSNVLLESAASCRPIISTNRAGCREAIDHGINGYLVEEQNSEDLIQKIETFLALSFEEKKAMGEAGREKVQRQFDRNIVVERYLETVGALCNRE